MAEPKTKQTDQSVEDFLECIPDEKKRKDSITTLELTRNATGLEPKMWGDSIVGSGCRPITSPEPIHNLMSKVR